MTPLRLRKQINGGKAYFYPINETAVLVCKLMGRRTLIERDFQTLEQLNFKIEVL